MSIAWDNLEPTQRAQILHFRPDLRPIGRCQKCGGNIIANHSNPYCLQCGAEYNQDGELIPTYRHIKVVKEQMSKNGVDNEY